MRILVTGAKGFLGFNFVNLIVRERPDWDVVKFEGSILNDQDVSRSFSCRPDVVVNFAAKVGAIASFGSPAIYMRTNAEGTSLLLDASHKHRVRRFIQMSTVDVYGSIERPTEKSPINPMSPYAISKAAADFLVLGSHAMETVVVRAPSIFGPFDRPTKMVPYFVGNVLRDQPICLFGDGLQHRDWLHVEDVARGVLLAIERGQPGEVYNLGTEQQWTNLEVARLIISVLGKPEHPIKHVEDIPGHGRIYAADFKKAASILGFRPQISFQEGLRGTVYWYEARIKKLDKSKLT